LLTPSELFDLTGRVAIVTGGGSGIGEGIAMTLAAAGAHVVVVDIDADAAGSVAARITSAGHGATARMVDVRARTAIDEMVEEIVDMFGRLDILCNNAGASFTAMVADIDEELFDAALALNLKAVLWGCQAALRVMAPRGGGVIVNTSSTAIDVATEGIAAYAMTKAAVAQLTRTLAIEAGRYGVRVNAIAPGFTDTNFYNAKKRDPVEGEPLVATYDAIVATVTAQSPLGIIGAPIDQAALVLYIVSDAARFVTGQIIRANGGIAMPW
jgi:3-oxoacyl-[acyl-carrier protein] reductase